MGQNGKLAEAFYSAMERGDGATAFGLIDANVVWMEAENFVYADRNPYRGLDAVLSGVFGRLASEWDGFAAVMEEIIDGGDKVVALGRYRAASKATGAKVNAQFVHVFTFKDHKIVAFQQYTDTAQFREALSLRAGA